MILGASDFPNGLMGVDDDEGKVMGDISSNEKMIDDTIDSLYMKREVGVVEGANVIDVYTNTSDNTIGGLKVGGIPTLSVESMPTREDLNVNVRTTRHDRKSDHDLYRHNKFFGVDSNKPVEDSKDNELNTFGVLDSNFNLKVEQSSGRIKNENGDVSYSLGFSRCAELLQSCDTALDGLATHVLEMGRNLDVVVHELFIFTE